MILLLAFTLSWLQGRFDSSDAKKASAAAMAWRPSGAQSIFESLEARGEGARKATGNVVPQLLGDVEVKCSTPTAPLVYYQFRVLLDGKKPPRAANEVAQQLV